MEPLKDQQCAKVPVPVIDGLRGLWLPSWCVLGLAIALGVAVWPEVLTRDMVYMNFDSPHLGMDDLRPSVEVVAQVCEDHILPGGEPLTSPDFLSDAVQLAGDPQLRQMQHIVARRRLACYMVMGKDTKKPTNLWSASLWIHWTTRSIAWRRSCMRYFEHYMALSAEKELVFFHHVSKSGGTTMCDNAFLNGCRPPSTSKTPREALPTRNSTRNSSSKGDFRLGANQPVTREENVLREPLQNTSLTGEQAVRRMLVPALHNRALLSLGDGKGLLDTNPDAAPDSATQVSAMATLEARRRAQEAARRARDEARTVSGVNCFAYNLLDGYIWRSAKLRGGASTSRNSSPSRLRYANISCAERKEYARNYDLNFMSNENYLTEPMANQACKEGILSLHILRDPHQRIMSHLHHVLDGRDCLRLPTECFPASSGFNMTELCSSKFTFVERWTHVNVSCLMDKWFTITNDYYTRTLGGPDAFVQPVNDTKQEDYNAAVFNLLNFDVIIILGHYMQRTMEKILLGFPFGMPMASNSREYSTSELTQEQKQTLFERNAFDRSLYDVGQALNSLDVVVLKAAESFCGQTTFPAPYNRIDLRHRHKICEAFYSSPPGPDPKEWATIKGRYEIQRRFFTIKKRKFHCGCGWAGSRQTSQEVKRFLPNLLRVDPTQMCPRQSVYL